MELNNDQFNNRVQWVRDLLSGNFIQTNGALRRGVGIGFAYCCLGVANCQVDPTWESGGAFIMKERQATQFGLSREDQGEAARWNDSNSYSFSRIADLVAYATEYKMSFDRVIANNVKVGYARDWLSLFD